MIFMLKEQYENLNKENANEKLERYFQTKTLQRLKGIGQFCGMDHIQLKPLKPIEYYSRFDHSKNIAYTASKLSDGLTISLAGAVHDVGTLAFSHVNSFKRGEALTQEHDELDVKSIVSKDEEFLQYLSEDGISLSDICTASRYPLIDKPVPTLCLDRVDGILTTCLIWQHTHSFEEIKKLYYMIGYCDNLNGQAVDPFNERLQNFEGEIVLDEWGSATYEDFFHAIHVYSRIMLGKESRYMMEVLGLTLQYYEDIGLITEQDLFQLSEQEIIEKILNSKYRDVWQDVSSMQSVRYAKDDTDGLVLYSKPKIRQANPLVMGQMQVCDISDISGEFYRELNPIGEEILKVDYPLTGDLNPSTVKVLTKYKKH